MGNISDTSLYPVRNRADIKNQDKLVGWDNITKEQYNYQIDDVRSFYNAPTQALLEAYNGSNNIAFFTNLFYYYNANASTGGFPATGKGGGRWLSVEDDAQGFANAAAASAAEALASEEAADVSAANALNSANEAESSASSTRDVLTEVEDIRDAVLAFFNVREIEDESVEISIDWINNVNVNKVHPLLNVSIPETINGIAEGDVVSLENWIEDGIIQITPQGDVTLNYATNAINLGEQGYLRYIGNNNWLLFGNI